MSSVIQVENLSKQYRLGQIGARTIREDVGRFWARVRGQEDPTLKIGQANTLNKISEGRRQNSEYIWALKDINFSVQQGEVLGIIGKNGAGKSTLLKILSKVTSPTTGTVTIYGRIASLLEVGTGFHPELSGRENIFLNGAILGMSKAEIRSKFDEIVDFSGVEKYIDTPVKRYSSGMYVRLAFAVAAHLEPEILIVDEVLAVGDAEFQKKCLGKMKDVSSEGRTVLFVSHNMAAVSELCQTSILLQNGTIQKKGITKDIISNYLNIDKATNNTRNLENIQHREGNGSIQFTRYSIKNKDNEELDFVVSGQTISIELYFKVKRKTDFGNIHFSIKILNENNIPLIHLSEYVNKGCYFKINEATETGMVRCTVTELQLPEGDYSLTFFCSNLISVFDSIESGGTLCVREGNYFGTGKTIGSKYGLFLVKSAWEITENK